MPVALREREDGLWVYPQTVHGTQAVLHPIQVHNTWTNWSHIIPEGMTNLKKTVMHVTGGLAPKNFRSSEISLNYIHCKTELWQFTSVTVLLKVGVWPLGEFLPFMTPSSWATISHLHQYCYTRLFIFPQRCLKSLCRKLLDKVAG